MDITYFISAFVGLLAGVLSGLFGIGGGIVMVPMLVAVFGWPLLEANAASLAAMLLPVGVLGCWAYYKAGYVNLRNSLWISLGLFIGSFGGAELAMAMNDNVSLLSGHLGVGRDGIVLLSSNRLSLHPSAEYFYQHLISCNNQ